MTLAVHEDRLVLGAPRDVLWMIRTTAGQLLAANGEHGRLSITKTSNLGRELVVELRHAPETYGQLLGLIKTWFGELAEALDGVEEIGTLPPHPRA